MGQTEGHGIGTHRGRWSGHAPRHRSALRHTADPARRQSRRLTPHLIPRVALLVSRPLTHGVSRRRALVTRPTRVAVLVAALVTGIVAATPGVGAVGTAAAAGPPATGRPTSAGGAAHSDPRLLGAPSLPSRALYGWGGNDAGQVGNGALGGGSSDGVTLPVQDADPSGQSFATIAAGGAFTVGLTTSGRAYAWGAGSLGQLGDGTTAGSTAPMPVAFPTLPAGPGGAPDVVTAVAAGSAHALALTSTGQVYAWGADLFGQLGDGTNAATDVPTPIDAPPGVTFTAVSAGGDHSLALASNGQVYAWGANTYGQLGDGTTTDRTRPTPVATPAGVTFTGIAAGTGHSLAVDSDGGVYSWGFDGSGQLGLGSTSDSALPQPVTMPAGTAVASVAAGGSHSLALSTSGLVFAWGSDVFGQLSSALVGTLPVDSDVPVQPLGLPPATTFVQISAGQTTSYALTSNGVPWVWGGDFFGQLGDGGSGVNAAVPEAMTTLPPGTAATGLFSGPDSSTSFLVTRAQQSITFPSVTGATYGGPPVDVAPVLDSGLNPSNSAEGACTGALVRLVLIGAGPCTVTSTQDGSFAYYPAAASTTFAVAPATLTVVPDARTTDAGSPLPTFTYHLTGFVDGDTATVVTGAADCTSDASAGSFPGDYAIRCTPGTLHAANYTFVAGPPAGLAVVASSSGYAVFGADGSLWAKGSVETSHGTSDAFAGSMAGTPLAAPVVGAAYTPLHDGYWMVASDGGIFAFGSARFEGSMGGKPLNRPIVGLAPTPDGGGYWEVAADGGIFSFGDAAFFGSTGNLTLVQPITGMAATPDGRGYWLVARDGGVFAFGDARFHGSTGGRVSLDPVVGLAPTPDGGGYWMVTRHGAVFPFGDAAFEGSLRYEILGAPIAGMAPTGDGKGYWLVGADGGVFAFGDAPFQGAVTRPPAPIVGII